jgi:hypothetical protein
LFGLDDALSSDVQAHQVIQTNSTRASISKQFSDFWRLFRVLGFDLFFPLFECKSSNDSLGIARNLHGDHQCQVWSRFPLI